MALRRRGRTQPVKMRRCQSPWHDVCTTSGDFVRPRRNLSVKSRRANIDPSSSGETEESMERWSDGLTGAVPVQVKDSLVMRQEGMVLGEAD